MGRGRNAGRALSEAFPTLAEGRQEAEGRLIGGNGRPRSLQTPGQCWGERKGVCPHTTLHPHHCRQGLVRMEGDGARHQLAGEIGCAALWGGGGGGRREGEGGGGARGGV